MIKAIADRPWIWIIVAYIAMVAVMAAFVVISVKYGDREVPVPHQKVDY
jgi:hypothetical protein